jgi:hypothetical protein
VGCGGMTIESYWHLQPAAGEGGGDMTDKLFRHLPAAVCSSCGIADESSRQL